MLKITLKSSEAQFGIGEGFVLPNHALEYLVGRLLTLVEAFGLNERQEKSAKELVKQEVYGSVRDYKLVESDLLTLVNRMTIKKENEQERRSLNTQDSSDMLVPSSWLKGDYELTFIEKE